MLFYFVRHGQTDANHKEVLAGSGLDHCLNEVGNKQALILAQDIGGLLPGKPRRLIASDMTRARETGLHLARKLELPLELEPGFREWHLGDWEGQPYARYSHLILGSGDPPGGESRAAFYARVDQTWRKAHHDGQPYLIVAHGAVWLALQDLLEIPRFKISNCQLVKVEKSARGWGAEILK